MSEQIEREIRIIAKHQFPSDQIENFISTFQRLLCNEMPLHYFLQISTDEGKELELGYFTNNRIVDVTLSNQKVHFYSYPLTTIRHIAITESNMKSTLTIQGEKKFDYNVVKPASLTNLEKYKNSLNSYFEKPSELSQLGLATERHFLIKRVDLERLLRMENILSRSMGCPISIADELDYFKDELPMGWFAVENSIGEIVGFIRSFKQNSEWSLGELFVEFGEVNRRVIAKDLLKAFLDSNRFQAGHRLRFDLNYSDADLNSLIEELGCSQKKQVFHYFEMQVSGDKLDVVSEAANFENRIPEVAEVLSHLHPVSELEAKNWIEEGSIRAVGTQSFIAAAAQIYFYPDSAEINRIATHPKYLRQGYAKQLVALICDDLRVRKIPRLFLKVEDSKGPAISFYQDFGFQEVFEKKQVWHSMYF